MSNFVVITEESDPKRIKLMIALKWGDGITDFINIKDTAFIHHPRFDSYYHNFIDYEDCRAAKFKIEHSLENYLKE